MHRQAKLKLLAEDLGELVAMLRLDSECRWREHFESSLKRAREMLEAGFSQDDLSVFSASVVHVFEGAGSFGDYAPIVYDRSIGGYAIIPGTERFEHLAGKVYDSAVSLRAVDQVG